MSDENETIGQPESEPTPSTAAQDSAAAAQADPAAGTGQHSTASYYARPMRFPRHTSHETGEGSLLNRTVDLVDNLSKPSMELLLVENGVENPVPLVFSHDEGMEVVDPARFDSYRNKPLYRVGKAKLGSVASLIDYTNRYKGSGTVLFADDDRSAPSLTSVFDYHEKGGPEDGGQRFGRHRAVHNLPLSDEWKAWQSLNGKPITMPNFARFLEDHIVDVLGVGETALSDAQQKFVGALGGTGMIADPARLMELATGLRIYESSQASQVVNLSSGEGEVVFTAAHNDGQGGKLNIPRLFVLAIPVFAHGDPYQIVSRLRYRKDGGGISFFYELWRDDLVFDHAFAEAADFAAKGTDVPLFLGRPE